MTCRIERLPHNVNEREVPFEYALEVLDLLVRDHEPVTLLVRGDDLTAPEFIRYAGYIARPSAGPAEADAEHFVVGSARLRLPRLGAQAVFSTYDGADYFYVAFRYTGCRIVICDDTAGHAALSERG